MTYTNKTASFLWITARSCRADATNPTPPRLACHGNNSTTTATIAHRLDPVLMELDAKLAACTDEGDRRNISAALAERETRVIGVYRQVNKTLLEY